MPIFKVRFEKSKNWEEIEAETMEDAVRVYADERVTKDKYYRNVLLKEGSNDRKHTISAKAVEVPEGHCFTPKKFFHSSAILSIEGVIIYRDR